MIFKLKLDISQKKNFFEKEESPQIYIIFLLTLGCNLYNCVLMKNLDSDFERKDDDELGFRNIFQS